MFLSLRDREQLEFTYRKSDLHQIYRFTLYSRNEVRSHVTTHARRLSSGVALKIKVYRKHRMPI